MTMQHYFDIGFILIMVIVCLLTIFFRVKKEKLLKELVTELTTKNLLLQTKYNILDTHYKEFLDMAEKKGKIIEESIAKADKMQQSLEKDLLKLIDEQQKIITKLSEQKSVDKPRPVKEPHVKATLEELQESLESTILSKVMKSFLADHEGNPFSRYKKSKENPWPEIVNKNDLKTAQDILATTISKKQMFIDLHDEKTVDDCIKHLVGMIKNFKPKE